MKTKPLTYQQFAEQFAQAYRANDDESRSQSATLEKRYPKYHAKWMLLNGPAALVEGSSVFIVQRSHSRTGYGRTISVFSFIVRTDAGYLASADRPQFQPLTLTYHVARLFGYAVRDHHGHDALRTDDYPQEFVAHLSQALFGNDKPSALNCEVL